MNSVALQADGKVLIGGGQSTSGYVRRLNADGTLDTSFNAGTGGANSEVLCVAAQSDGKVLVAGSFTSVNGTSRNKIARVNADGTLDTSFNPGTGPNNAVRSVAVQLDGKVLIGGDFGLVNGAARNHIARLNADGSLDTLFNPGAGSGGSKVHSIAVQPDGKMLIGGAFTSVAGTARNSIARLNADGSLDTLFNAGTDTNGWVRSVVVQTDGKVLVHGKFPWRGKGFG